MFCWGKGSEGQLGLGKIEEQPILSPRLVKEPFGVSSQVKEVVCGWEHTALLKNDGVVYTCGSNEYGQLGHKKEGTRFGEC